jgi:hypothetical protein
MTEAEWLACDDPTAMLEFLRGKVSDRKLRLFAVACGWKTLRLYPHQTKEKALQSAELLADRLATNSDRRAALSALKRAGTSASWEQDLLRKDAFFAAFSGSIQAASQVVCSISDIQYHVFEDGRVGYVNPEWMRIFQLERATQADYLREVFGLLPFRFISRAPAWQTTNVVALADAIYAARAFDRLPILADALEDAGCDNRDILDHCRQPGVHARGCWVVDLILSKDR